ncbi:MAG: proline iminopeptidase-family hydrolase [Planctomycetota bacterium]|nr:proline iminopeptidase-family hydrolase [Planctomycetota bacterium]
MSAGEGFIDVPGGKVWYQVVGSGNATPLLVLHGGPGIPSDYLSRLSKLSDERPVVFYDQLGCGKSDRPTDKSLWKTERFVEELATVRQKLNLEEVHILGHSWGTMLATDYMLTKPSGVRSLIFSSPSISIPRWLDDANKFRAQLPADVQAVLKKHEDAGTTDSEEYQNAVTEYYKLHVCRIFPFPPEMESALKNAGMDVYLTMWGPSEFFGIGNLKDYDRSSRLKEITVPVMFTAGHYDEATPETAGFYQSQIPGSSLVIFENSSHMAMLEETDRFIQVVRDFLKGK